MATVGAAVKSRRRQRSWDRNISEKMRGIFFLKKEENSTASKARQTEEGKLSVGNPSGDLLQERFFIKGNLDS